jgi:hypothetical protein
VRVHTKKKHSTFRFFETCAVLKDLDVHPAIVHSSVVWLSVGRVLVCSIWWSSLHEKVVGCSRWEAKSKRKAKGKKKVSRAKEWSNAIEIHRPPRLHMPFLRKDFLKEQGRTTKEAIKKNNGHIQYRFSILNLKRSTLSQLKRLELAGKGRGRKEDARDK